MMRLYFLSFFLCFYSAFSAHKKIVDSIEIAAHRFNLDPKLIEAIVKVESNFRSTATSKKGAMGLMQLMPLKANECEVFSPYHGLNNLMGACQCFRQLINRYRGNLELALAAYNSGPSNVDKYDGIPPFRETEEYVKKVLSLYEVLKNRGH